APAQFKINGGGDDKHLGEVVAAVHNYGSNPIRNVAVVVTLPTNGRHLILPHQEMIGPGENHDFRQCYQTWIPLPGSSSGLKGKAPVTVCFIDHTDQAWLRTSDGDVARTTVPYPFVEEALKTFGSVRE
ncbi:hypothetical protein, partial [Micromonospora sp. M61]|uniref:hypothetical protein n=1 Tax=Micromonospora sp. M61 TaxID=2824890 RepID=UPI001B38D357